MTNRLTPYLCLLLCLPGCGDGRVEPHNKSFDDIAANEAVKAYMQSFEGIGIMSDGSAPPAPNSTLASFEFPDDLAMDLLLAEPRVNQPVEINFDHRGRLWVVQYNQYPYPEGVRVNEIDNHSRVIYDNKLAPPGEGPAGADKITVFEDTNGDGAYDKAIDAVTGLNITTGVTLGRGKLWVLSPPYLVAYPDPDGDGIPDGKPVVHLEGFGLEDTHALANSLRWGPDGWLYGAQGSTAIATVSSEKSKNVHFKGQAIWRYHPETKIFEIFGEGGGNTFDTEFDAKGRMYSGDNGTTRGFYYKQGGYYRKNWGKHGALTNPYAFGYLPGLKVVGKQMRFTHAWIKYEGGSLPERYNQRLFALNPLHNFVQLSRMDTKGSTFICTDEDKVLKTTDKWFRPVDIKAGPDGAVYIADWSDSRMSHVNPIDNWHKNSGRIYRLRNKDQGPPPAFDLSKLSNDELAELLTDENKWFRQQALRIIGDRKDPAALPKLTDLFRSGNPQTALEALWAIHLSGGFSEAIALEAIAHPDPFVRLWGVRLTGDRGEAAQAVAAALARMAAAETDLEVIGQLASSAKRLPTAAALPVVEALCGNERTATDPETRLFTWWATEAHAESGREELLAWLGEPETWAREMMTEVILPRLIQRYVMAGGRRNQLAAANMLAAAPTDEDARLLYVGVQEGLRGQDLALLPAALTEQLRAYQDRFGGGKLLVGLRRNEEAAVTAALAVIADAGADPLERKAYATAFGELDRPESVAVLTKIAGDGKQPVAVRLACFGALTHYGDSTIGQDIAKAYAYHIRAEPALRAAAFRLFASRPEWTLAFLELVHVKQSVKPAEVPPEIVRQFKLGGNDEVNRIIGEVWPEVTIASSAEKAETVLRVKNALAGGTADLSRGGGIYARSCGGCHKLGEAGGNTGPDLTGYDRSNLNYLVLNIVDPSADVREGYVNYVIEKADGQSLFGTIIDRTDALVTLRNQDGEETTLARAEIKNMEALGVSLMPERILDPLTDQEIRDLFAYLQQPQI